MEKKKGVYDGYNDSRYVHFRQVKVSGIEAQDFRTENGAKTRINPKMERRIIPFEEIKNINLDEYGTLTPQLDTEDYTIVANYLLDFWGAIIGSEAVMTYIHLKRHAYGKKDYCFPDIETISMKMNKSVNSVKKYIGILEEHHFIAQFNRYNKEDKNREVSPFFKVRRFVPLLTDEMYDGLPKKMKKLHDEFTDEYKNLILTSHLSERDTIINEIIANKEVIGSKKVKAKAQEVMAEQMKYEFVMDLLDEDTKEATSHFTEIIRERVSVPSFETWFTQLIFKRTGEFNWTIYCPNNFALEWLSDKYDGFLHDWLHENPRGQDAIRDVDIIEYRLLDDLAIEVR